MHLGEILEKAINESETHISKAQFARDAGYKSKVSLYNAFKNPNAKLDLFAVGVQRYGLVFPKEVMEKLSNLGIENVGKRGVIKFVSMDEHLEIVKKYNQVLEDKLALVEENLELYRKIGVPGVVPPIHKDETHKKKKVRQ